MTADLLQKFLLGLNLRFFPDVSQICCCRHHQFCHLKSETSIKSAQRALTATESVVSPKMSSEKAEKQKSPESCSGNTSFRKHNSSTLQIILNSDGEEDEDLPAKVADKGGDDKSSVKGALATINSTQVPGEVGMSETEPQQKTASASVDQNIQKVPWKRKRIGADDSAPKTPVKRLQTNTCKVCQAVSIVVLFFLSRISRVRASEGQVVKPFDLQL